VIFRTTCVATHEALLVDANAVRISETMPDGLNQPKIKKPTLAALQRLMWHQVGLVRDEAGLTATRTELAAWEAASCEPITPAEHELNNMILIGKLMATAALERCESRGSHCRSDFPNTDPGWRKHIVVSKAPVHVTQGRSSDLS
jgi:L-aspartate oxidase